MKKSIAIILLLCSMCLILSSCGNRGYEKGKTFSSEFLASVSLENMPFPEFAEYALNNRTAGQETLRIETDLKSFEAYINSFIEYMNAREGYCEYTFDMPYGDVTVIIDYVSETDVE